MFKLVQSKSVTTDPLIVASGQTFEIKYKDPSGNTHHIRAELPDGSLDYWAIYHATGEYGFAECYCAYLVITVDDDDFYDPTTPEYDCLYCMMVVSDKVVFTRVQNVPKTKKPSGN